MGFGPRGGHGRFAMIGEAPAKIPKERRAKTLRRIAAFFLPYRAEVAVVVAAILLTSGLGLINPLLLRALIDDAIPHLDFGKLNLYVGLMIFVPIVSGLIGVGQSYLNNNIGQHVMQDLRMALYAHLQKMPLRFFTETKTGEIQSRLANDVGGVQSVVTDTAASLTSNVAIAISTIVAMLLVDWRLTALSLGVLPFFMYLTFRVGKVRRQVSTETQKSLAEISAVTEETLSVSGILLSKTFGQQRQSTERFRGLNARLARLQIRQAMVGRWFFMIIGTVFSITPAFVYWLAGYLAINHDRSAPTIGAIVAFTTLQSRLFFPIGQLLNVQVEIQGALALFDRIFEYLEMDPEIVDAPDAVALDRRSIEGRVRFRHVSFHYPTKAVPSARAMAASVGGVSDRSEADGLAARDGGGDSDLDELGTTPSDGPVVEAERRAELNGQAPAELARRRSADGLVGLETRAGRDGKADGNGSLGPEGGFGTDDGDGAVAPDEAPRDGLAPVGGFGLEDIDFEAQPGQLVALVGPSGAGKTTTTYLIPRLYDVDDGSVEIDSRDVRRVTLTSLGEILGFVTQETYLFHSSVRENLRYAKPDATDEELEAAARAAAIHERILELPAGYDTVVGERGYKLSGGEKQRVAIARVLLKDPRILILDEATSALDTVSERLIQAALERLMTGRTTIAIAHRLSTILRADKILVFERGRIVERGTHAELLEEGGLYARLYREQFLVSEQSAEPSAVG